MKRHLTSLLELFILFLALGFGIQLLGNTLCQKAYQNAYERAVKTLDTFRKSPVSYGKKHHIVCASTIAQELQTLPYPSTYRSNISFSDSWGGERTVNSNSSDHSVRLHEGCDLMYDKNQAGQVPILSMTDGTVEQKGWLTLGGYRIGIRSSKGIYYYYAHLDSYAANLEQGDTVKAGQFLGFMGNTGYGPEGTTDQFDVHLHVGIYVNQITYSNLHLSFLKPDFGLFQVHTDTISPKWEDVSVNPYPYLMQLVE